METAVVRRSFPIVFCAGNQKRNWNDGRIVWYVGFIRRLLDPLLSRQFGLSTRLAANNRFSLIQQHELPTEEIRHQHD